MIVKLRVGGYPMRVKNIAPNVLAKGGLLILCEWQDTGGHVKFACFYADDLSSFISAEVHRLPVRLTIIPPSAPSAMESL